MAYTAVPTKSTGELWSAADNNTYIKDNFAAGVPDIFTTKGDLAAATAVNAADRLAVGDDADYLVADSGAGGGTVGIKWLAKTLLASRHTVAGALTINNNTVTIVNYATEVYDTNTLVTEGAAWKFTVPTGGDGKYHVIAALLFASVAGWEVGEEAYLALYKNGAIDCLLCRVFIEAAGTFAVWLSGSAEISLVATDYIDIRAYQNNDANLNTDADDENGYVSIVQLI